MLSDQVCLLSRGSCEAVIWLCPLGSTESLAVATVDAIGWKSDMQRRWGIGTSDPLRSYCLKICGGANELCHLSTADVVGDGPDHPEQI